MAGSEEENSLIITFLPHERKDIPLRVKWLNNKNANVFAVDDPNHVTNIAEQEKWFDDYERKFAFGQKKFFTICDEEKPIGFMGLSNIDRGKNIADVFIMIGEDGCRGRGIGKQSLNFLTNYAFGELGLETLALEVDERNEAAIKLYQSCGFKMIGKQGGFVKMELVVSK